MKLNFQQKDYIRKNIKTLTPEKIALDLNIPEKEISNYLKKKLRPEKFERLMEKEESWEEKMSRFSFNDFFLKNQGVFIILFFLVFAVYFNSFGNGFVSDDVGALRENSDLGKFKTIFSFWGIGFFQNAVHFLVYNLFGPSPFFFRLPNILLHLGSTFLIFSILSQIGRKRAAFFTAVIFAVHPILIESVGWISGAPYTYYSFFLLLSFLFYLRFPSGRKKYLGILFFFFALVSMEKAAAFPGVLLAWELSKGKLKTSWKKLVPYFTLSFVWLIAFSFRIAGRKTEVADTFHGGEASVGSSLLQIPVSFISYLKLIFWPQKLSLYQTGFNLSVLEYNFYVIGFILFFGLTLYFYFKNKKVFFWMAFFIILLSPTVLSFGLSWMVAERYAYLASLGIFAIIGIFFDQIAEKMREQKKLIYGVFVFLILLLSVRSVIRNFDWKDEDSLWIATAKISPSSEASHNNLGDVYARRKDHEKAIEEFQKAVEINPRYANAYHNLAISLKETGRMEESIENYKKAIEINPRLWQSWLNLGLIYFEKEDYQKSLENVQKAFELEPQNEEIKKILETIQEKIAGEKI